MTESTPGDYYERKRNEAEILLAQINAAKKQMESHHPYKACACNLCAYTRQDIYRLERKLDLARYTGD